MKCLALFCTALAALGAFHPITIRPQAGIHTIHFYDALGGWTRNMSAGWYYGTGNEPELAISKQIVFRNTLAVQHTMTTCLISRDVFVRAGVSGTINVDVWCWADAPVPAGATAQICLGSDCRMLDLAGPPRQGVYLQLMTVPVFPAPENATYTVTLSTENNAVAFMPENTPTFRVQLVLNPWVS